MVLSENTDFEGRPCAPQAAPDGFHLHQYQHCWDVPHSYQAVWDWLNRPETFTESQLPPYRVEFVSQRPEVPAGFYEGGLNIHHGPFLVVAGTLTEMRPPEYRDLQYFYGSFVLSLRLVRPTRLQFWVEPIDSRSTRVRVQLDALVRGWFVPIWDLGNRGFWWSFGYWLKRL